MGRSRKWSAVFDQRSAFTSPLGDDLTGAIVPVDSPRSAATPSRGKGHAGCTPGAATNSKAPGPCVKTGGLAFPHTPVLDFSSEALVGVLRKRTPFARSAT